MRCSNCSWRRTPVSTSVGAPRSSSRTPEIEMSIMDGSGRLCDVVSGVSTGTPRSSMSTLSRWRQASWTITPLTRLARSVNRIASRDVEQHCRLINGNLVSSIVKHAYSFRSLTGGVSSFSSCNTRTFFASQTKVPCLSTPIVSVIISL